MKFLATVILSTVLIFTTSRSTAQIDPVLAADLQNMLDTSITKYGLEGVEMTVILPGECSWTGVSGYATSPTDPVDTNRYWHWASVTKAFTGAVVLQLYDDGIIDIDDPIGNYWNAKIKGLTSQNGLSIVDSLMPLRHFLNHTTNIPNTWYNGSNMWGHVFDSNCSVWTLDSVLNPLYWEDPNPIPFDPNQNHQYVAWNNYVILGLLVEAVTGNSLSVEMQNRVFTPLGLSNSYLAVNGINMQTLNGSYNNTFNNSIACRDDYMSTRGGSSWLISSSKETASFMRALHNDQIISSGIMTQAREKTQGPPFWPTGTFPCIGDYTIYYGLGSEIAEIYPFNSNDTLRLYGHGGNGIHSSGTWHLLDSNITVSLVSNDYSQLSTYNTGQLLSDVFCHLFGNISPGTCITSISETDMSSFSIYPNPGSGMLQIELTNNGIADRVEILSIEGKMVREFLNVNSKLSVPTEDLPRGVYLVRVFTESGWSVSRWVKQ
jgi:CubicO group peptidase (beta-lactamase class C family)